MATINYYSVNGQILGEASPKSPVRRYAPDALGTVAATFDTNGALENSYRFLPYGMLAAKTGTAADPKFTWVGSLGYRQTGASWSDIYVRARHYSSNSVSWTTIDPLWPGFPPYSYAMDAPTFLVDPSGRWTIRPVPCKGITGQIVSVGPGDVTGVVGGKPPHGTHRFPLTPGPDCTKGFKDSKGRDCVCTNGSFFDLGSGFPVGSYKDCQGRTIGGTDTGLLPVITGHGVLHGKPVGSGLPRPGEPIGRTAACTSPRGGLLFIVVVDDSNGASGSDFRKCMQSLCKAPNKIVMLDGSGSSQIWHNGKPVYAGDRRSVVNWLVICH